MRLPLSTPRRDFLHFSHNLNIINVITRNASEFYSLQQRFVFVHPDAEIDPVTNLPDDKDDYVILDVDDILTVGTPMKDDVEFEFYAFLTPGEII